DPRIVPERSRDERQFARQIERLDLVFPQVVQEPERRKRPNPLHSASSFFLTRNKSDAILRPSNKIPERVARVGLFLRRNGVTAAWKGRSAAQNRGSLGVSDLPLG